MPHGVSILFPDLQPESVTTVRELQGTESSTESSDCQGNARESSSLAEELRWALSDTLEFQTLLEVPLSITDSLESAGFLPLCSSVPCMELHSHGFSGTPHLTQGSVTSWFQTLEENSVLLCLSKQWQSWRSWMFPFPQIKRMTAEDSSIYF